MKVSLSKYAYGSEVTNLLHIFYSISSFGLSHFCLHIFVLLAIHLSFYIVYTNTIQWIDLSFSLIIIQFHLLLLLSVLHWLYIVWLRILKLNEDVKWNRLTTCECTILCSRKWNCTSLKLLVSHWIFFSKFVLLKYNNKNLWNDTWQFSLMLWKMKKKNFDSHFILFRIEMVEIDLFFVFFTQQI